MEIPVGKIRLPLKPLNQTDFAPFGTVIQNPSSAKSTQQSAVTTPQWINSNPPPPPPPPPAAAAAEVVNQGTALKFSNVTEMVNLYGKAPSRRRARAVMNLFVCTPRPLIPDEKHNSNVEVGKQALFPVKILERHPFTTQTFIPLGLPSLDFKTRYLVIVAPSFPPLPRKQEGRPPPFPKPQPRRRRSLSDLLSRARPPPFPENDPKAVNDAESSRERRLPASGLPDLQNLRAFIADGSQAITYGAGVWHAPMVVLGTNPVEFVVVQHANGVAREDCQEVEILDKGIDQGIFVVVPSSEGSVELDQALKAKL